MTQPITVRFPPPDRGRDRLVDLPIDKIRPDPANTRGEVGDVSDLIASMTEVGLLQPITVRYDLTGDDYVIRLGARRWTAARQLGWTTIRCIVRAPDAVEDEDDIRALEEMFFENNHRADIDPVREGRALRAIFQARKFGSIPALALHVGRSVQWCSDRLGLLKLPEDVQARISAGELTIRESTDRAREVRGLPPRQPTRPASSSATRTASAPRTSRSDVIAAAIRLEAGVLRQYADDPQTEPTDGRAMTEVADRLDDLARRVENGDDIR